jgi:hypothetical protein
VASEIGCVAVEDETVHPAEKPQRQRVEHRFDTVRSLREHLGADAPVLDVVDGDIE